MAISIAELIIILAIIVGVVFFTNNEGIPARSPDNKTGAGLLGHIFHGNVQGAPSENTTAPAQTAIIPQKKDAGASQVSNRAVPVVTDTPLKKR